MENSNSKSWFSGWLGLLEFVFGDGAGTVLFAKLLSMGVMVGASAAVAAGDLVTDDCTMNQTTLGRLLFKLIWGICLGDGAG